MRDHVFQRALKLISHPKRLLKKLEYRYIFALDRFYNYILRVQHPETYESITRINQGNALYGGAYKYVHLHRLLERFKPETILEFGSGSSTGVFAEYAQKRNAKVHTVEDSLVWLKNTKDALGLSGKPIAFILAPSEGCRGVPHRCYYRYKANQAFDFVYVDGPPLVIDGQDDGTAVNWNVIELIEAGLLPKCIVVDGRVSTVQYLVKNFSSHYKVFLRETGFLLPGYHHHSYFVKRAM